MAQRVTQLAVEAVGTGQTSGARVTQLALEAAGTGQTSGVRVTQLALEAVGTGQSPLIQVTQLYTEVAALYLLDIFSFTTVPSAASVNTGGAIVLIQPDIPIVGVSVVPSTSTVYTAGGAVTGLPITGASTVTSTKQVFTGGSLTQGISITGASTIPSTKAVNSGGVAVIGVYTITPGITSQIALMDLGAIDLGQVLGSQGVVDIVGPFVGVPASTATVYTGGALASGINITGASTVSSTKQVFTAGVVQAGLNVVGSATVASTKTVYSPGSVVLQSGILILPGQVIPSTANVRTGGVLAGLGITGTTTIPSTATVYPGGILSGIPSALFLTSNDAWAGHGMTRMGTKPANQWDQSLEDEKAIASLLMQLLVEEGDVVGQRGLAGLGMVDAPSSTIPSQLTLSRRNFFERGKLLTPADAGAADHTVLTFQVPTGYFGVLLGYYCQYLGTGFVQGSGDIVFRLKSGNAWVRNMGNLLYTVGSFSNTFSMPLMTLLSSDDTLTFQVNVPNTSGLIQVGSSYILCGLQGWLYPMSAFKQIRKC